MTLTILQGRGTALYTPLEQYGGDAGHTDARSDIYSFGATLYHLFTNEAPIEARERFLQPDSLPSLRQLNPNLAARTERAVLWAMSLHPDERPQTIDAFRQVLLGNAATPSRPISRRTSHFHVRTIEDILESPIERYLAWTALGLAIFSLIISLI
jgi:serine/threonine-protein kinase